MPNSNHPLDKHDLRSLEDAAKELNTHIRDRKRIFRPSTPRRLLGLCFSIPAIVIGTALLIRVITLYDHPISLPIFGAVALVAGGLIWIYSDWFE